MPALPICALVGVVAGLWLPVFAGAELWPVVLSFLLPLVWWLVGTHSALLLFAFGLASLHGHWYKDAILPELLFKQDIVVSGVVTDFPRSSVGTTSFMLQLTDEMGGWPRGRNLQLRIYNNLLMPEAGEHWQFKVRLKRPYATLNEGVTDRERYWLMNRVHATGYVRSSVINRRLNPKPFATMLVRWRAAIRERLERVLQGNPMLGLIAGICIGVRNDIDASMWRVFRATGTGHLIAISGLHIGLVALAAWYPGRALGWLLNYLKPAWHPLFPARMAALLAAFCYASLAGLTVPTVRAGLMVACVLVLGGLNRRRAIAPVLMTALMVILFFDPLDVLSAAFWLSFLAVAILGLIVSNGRSDDSSAAYPRRGLQRVRDWLAKASAAQVMLSLGLAAPGLIFFAQISVVSVVANLVAVPVFSFVLLPLTLLGAMLTMLSVTAGEYLLSSAGWGLSLLMDYLFLLASIPGATRMPVSQGWLTQFLAILAMLSVVLPKPLPGRLMSLFLLIAALNVKSSSLPPRLAVQVVDVGQGLAVLVQTQFHNLLYDAGPGWRNSDAGSAIIVPMLKAAGIARLDSMIVSHGDSDHSGGAASILQALPVERLIAPANLSQPDLNAEECRAGMSWQWDGVEFHILHPSEQSSWSDNNGSCVLFIRVGDSAALLPGDIERAAERVLVAEFELEPVDLVLAPHHGSKTSSTFEFVTAVDAGYVVFSAGYGNRWGFPLAPIVSRWSASGSCVLVTAVSGAVRFIAAEEGGFRLQSARRASLLRPWPIRDSESMLCVNTINGADGGV